MGWVILKLMGSLGEFSLLKAPITPRMGCGQMTTALKFRLFGVGRTRQSGSFGRIYGLWDGLGGIVRGKRTVYRREGERMMRIFVFMIVGLWTLATGVAMADSYRLRPGDLLDVSVWQDPKLNRQIVVGPDGSVAFPLAGRFKAGGLTTEAVEGQLKSRLQKQYTADLDVTVSFVQSQKRDAKPLAKDAEWTIYVTGEVNKPGAFVVPKRAPTILQAIALSGGLGPFAAERRIHVYRKANGKEGVYSFDYHEYSKGVGMDHDITLRNGDVVVVPERGLFE